jgi:hypothetical protein
LTTEQKDKMVAANKARLTGAVEHDANDGTNKIRLAQIRSIQRMQRQFGERIIRRTTASKDYFGKVIVDLPPYRRIPGMLTLTEREMAAIQDIAEKTKDS